MTPTALFLFLAAAALAVWEFSRHNTLTGLLASLKADLAAIKTTANAHFTHAIVTAPAKAAPPAPAPTPDAPDVDPHTIRHAITADAAYARYAAAGGMAAAATNRFFGGYLDLYEMNWLRSLTPADRHAWAVAFCANEKTDPASVVTEGGIDTTVQCASYLSTIRDNYGITFGS